MIKTVLKITLFVLIAVLIVNDLGRFVQAEFNINDTTTKLLNFGAKNGRALGRDEAAKQASAFATRHGVVLTGYGQDEETVSLVTVTPLEGTWVIVPFINLISKKPIYGPYQLTEQGSRALE